MAAVQSYLARSLLRLDLLNEAAEHYQGAADNYERIGQFDDASYDYQQAATLWYRLGMQENALLCVERGVFSAFHYGNPIRAAAVLADVPDDVHRTRTGEMYLDTLRQFAGGKTARLFVGTMINFAIHCKKDHDAELFQNGLKVITESLTSTVRPEVLYALAQAIEQAGNELMTTESLYKLASHIAKDVDHLHFRHMPGQASIWTM